MLDEMFSDAEIEQLAKQLVKGMEIQGLPDTEDIRHQDLETVVRWVCNTRFQNALLGLVLKGQVCVAVKDNAIGFALDPEVESTATIADILPAPKDLRGMAPDFTGGMESGEYIRSLRE